jgi:hypothetical protein
LAVENGSADYSSTTGAPHEYFGQASNKRPISDEFFHYKRIITTMIKFFTATNLSEAFA